ncbi:MAG: NAD(P)H-dependent oxidoreductase subunit E [Thermodesulfovibrionales bacterium]|nr:NAD(P)H-dependent oxidoreductase subunit E [Thermodesulfovibrionales bacterium]
MSSNILILDDDITILTGCKKVLRAEGYDVITTNTAKEALDILNQHSIDVILTDIVMPEMDGMEFIRNLRASRPDLQVIIITGYPSQDTLREALSLKVIDYIPKPFSPALLVEVVKKAVEVKEDGVKKTIPHSLEEEFPKESIDEIIKKYKNKTGGIIPALLEAQEVVGYLPKNLLKYISKKMRLSTSEVYGIVSFYSFFSLKPRGKHKIKVCLGTACYVKGAEEIINRFQKGLDLQVGGITSDRKYSLETARCLGACGLAPVVIVNTDTYGSVNPVNALELLKQYD